MVPMLQAELIAPLAVPVCYDALLHLCASATYCEQQYGCLVLAGDRYSWADAWRTADAVMHQAGCQWLMEQYVEHSMNTNQL